MDQMKKIKAFVIALSKIESSITSALTVVDKLIEYDFDAQLFEGTYGNDAVKHFRKEKRRAATYGIKTELIPISDYNPNNLSVNIEIGSTEVLQRIPWTKLESKKLLRPGVIGCFYSHYRLWQKCIELNEPIFIFEDDVIFERGYVPVEFDEILMVCTGKIAYKHRHYSKFLYEPEGDPCAIDLRNASMPGAVGYGITPLGAKKLVDAYRIEMLPADTAMNVFVVKLQHHNYLMGRAAIEEDGKISLTSSKIWSKK